MKSRDMFREYLMPVLVAAMQTCWLFPWALLIGGWIEPNAGQSLASPSMIFILLLTARLATRNFLRRGLPIEQVRADLVALGLFAAIIAVRVDHFPTASALDLNWITVLVDDFANLLARRSLSVFGAVFALFIWWRGIVMERDQAVHEDMEELFRNGAIALVLFLLVAAIGGAAIDALQTQVGGYVVGYFLVGLTGLAIARLESIREQGRKQDENPLPFNRQWSGLVISIIAAMLLLTLALAQILSFDLLDAILTPVLNLIQWTVIGLAYVVVVPLFYILNQIGQLLKALIHFGDQPLQFQLQDNPLPDDLKNNAPVGFPPELILWAKWSIVGIIAIVALIFLARSIARWNAFEASDELDEERDSVWNEASLRATIRAWLASLWQRIFRREAPQQDQISSNFVRPELTSPLALTIREVYRQLLAFGARAGTRRPAWTTPYEHLPRLQEHLTPPEDLAAITEAYVRTRYGPDVPSEEDARLVRERWDKIKEIDPT